MSAETLRQATLFVPVADYRVPWSGRTLVLSCGARPTVDIYFRTRLDVLGEVIFQDCCHSRRHDLEKLLSPGCFVIIVRHCPRAALKVLAGRTDLAGVAYFMDDDIPGSAEDPGLPRQFALKTWSRFRHIRGLLGRVCDRIWVSNERLASRYGIPLDCIVAPRFIGAPVEPLIYFYHGGGTHQQDYRFVRRLVAEIQAAYDHTVFELIDTGDAARLFRGLPRLRVNSKLTWREFLMISGSGRYDIGLAPLQRSRYNSGRTHNKLIDISRCGAVGIYSTNFPHAGEIERHNAGFLAENRVEAWAEVFATAMAANREQMVANALKLAKDLGERPSELEGLLGSRDRRGS